MLFSRNYSKFWSFGCAKVKKKEILRSTIAGDWVLKKCVRPMSPELPPCTLTLQTDDIATCNEFLQQCGSSIIFLNSRFVVPRDEDIDGRDVRKACSTQLSSDFNAKRNGDISNEGYQTRGKFQRDLPRADPSSMLTQISLNALLKKSRGSFFSEEAKEMVDHFLDTVPMGYLSKGESARISERRQFLPIGHNGDDRCRNAGGGIWAWPGTKLPNNAIHAGHHRQ
ncbi:hypothetical protein B0H19DRAFT_1086105 [Mycena capillaripes]|nr:hypothetical protein B0H19DRAFT_1086105 [Mycena capillaripes]